MRGAECSGGDGVGVGDGGLHLCLLGVACWCWCRRMIDGHSAKTRGKERYWGAPKYMAGTTFVLSSYIEISTQNGGKLSRTDSYDGMCPCY